MTPSRFRRLLPVLACTLLACAAPAADKTDAAALETLKQSNDRLGRFVLDNGLTCLVKEDHSAPVVSIQIWVGTGSIHEEQLLGAGLSHYVEHMIFKGTPTRKPGEIARQIIGLGGQLNAYTSLDRTVYFTDIPSAGWKQGLDVLADAVINATFPADEWEREKNVILREFAMGKDSPDRRINELMFKTAYSAHPYRLPVIGLREIFTTISREDLTGYFHRHYVPDNTVAVVVGDLNADEAKQTLTRLFAAYPRRPVPPVYVPQEPRQTAPRFVREAGPYNISRLTTSFHTVSLADKDAPALELLAAVAGGSQSSGLVQDIKETRRLVHNIQTESFTAHDPGLFIVSANLDPSQETAVVEAIHNAVTGWSSIPFSKTEVEKAKRLLLVGALSNLQSMHGQAHSYAEGELFMGDARYSEIYLARLRAVTPADLMAVARKYLIPENRSTVILGPEQRDTGKLKAAMSQPSEVVKRKLSNGVPLILREDHRLPFVYICAAFTGGTLAETEQNTGITSLMTELLPRGTPHRSALDIAGNLERLGAELSPFAGANSFGLRGRCLSGDTTVLMETLFDCLADASFPTNEVDKQKTVQLAAIAEQHEHPFTVAKEALDEIIFKGHPYRFPQLGHRDSVGRLDQAALLDYRQRQLVTGNMALAIFGDITSKQAESLAEKYCRRIRRDQAPARVEMAPQPSLPVRVEKREPREQCIVMYGFPGVGVDDPRRDPLALLDAAMSGMSSRLFTTVRDQRGLAYYANTMQRLGLGTGEYAIYAGIRADALPEVECLIRDEIARVTTTGLEAAEIAGARNMVIGEQEMRLQDNGDLAMTCVVNELLGLGFAHDFSTRARIEAVTPEQIRQAAISVLSTNKLAISVVLPTATKPVP